MRGLDALRCPTCNVPVSPVPDGNCAWPFCCDRCKLIDLGAWAAEERVIAGDASEDDVFSEDASSPLIRH